MLEVLKHIAKYFEEHLPQYTIINVLRKSSNPEDDYLYMVVAKRKEKSKYIPEGYEYAVWTTWNESTRSLNGGHYDLEFDSVTNLLNRYLVY